MKILKIGENININITKDNIDKSINSNREFSPSKGADELILELKSKGLPNSLKDEMKEVQRKISLTQAKIDAVSRVSKLLKEVKEYSDEVEVMLREVYNTSKFEDIYLLDDIKEELFSKDILTIYQALEKEIDKLSQEVRQNQKSVSSIMVKFQNIATFIDNLSINYVDDTVRLMLTGIDKSYKVINLSPETIIKFLSN
ncbi:MAG: hypothetical protein RMJ37_00705 [Spirochaetia bacterium]|nr:hypothetical protein [Spirochaetota bacterium]MCX8096047.1 hypothetical protein [Spirochaetota bacterium]MDW8111842.1 hypothetical protein [Spirochaetia bacterium]